MVKPGKDHKFLEAPQLSDIERQEIEKKINFETSKSFHSMVKLGAFANIFGALFYVLAIYNPVKSHLVLYWYGLLVIASLINVLWAKRFEYNHITPKEISRCRTGFLYILILICLIWGSTGVLFISNENEEQIITVIFLAAVLICFSFSTAMDLTMGVVSILCLLTPSILYNGFLAIPYFHQQAPHINLLNKSVSSAFIVLGLFMLIAAFFSNKVLIKVFRLGYENALLSKKLENINKFLEERVNERTEALETSLKLVTYQATHDLLTELPNERLLYDKISESTQKYFSNHHKVAIACFSLNGMMKINDGLGHQAASSVIQLVAKRFVNEFGNNNIYFIGLLRRAVFVIIIEPIYSLPELEQYVDDLFIVLNDPFYIAKQSIKLTGSVGVSIFPDHGRDMDTLITNAEAARVLAVQRGGNSVRFYNAVINANASRQLNIENLLYQAIENNELILNYQPFINLKNGSICGVEALVRWRNPILGLVSPMDFIPLAEMNGMIIPIGEWVLRTACEQLKIWQDEGYKSFSISVNLSAKQLEDKNLSNYIEKVLNELNLDPKYLELELTESEVFRKEAIPIINKLSEKGVLLAIDDFGTGYSEFTNLKFFKVDKIKIDKIFIQDIDVSVDSRNIVINTIGLAKRMKIKCLAEGVETKEQLDFLKKNGCDIMQGYYFSRPLSAPDFIELLRSHPNTKSLGNVNI